MSSPLILSVGMPRAGSGWYYNLTHDLITVAGGVASQKIRRRYWLQGILTEVNCNIGALSTKRLLPVMIPTMFGNTYVIKAHDGPSPLALRFIRRGKILPTYIYRDPRDALLSAYEYGLRKRAADREGVFANIKSIEQAIFFMCEYVHISEAWLSCEQALHTRYEDLLLDYPNESKRLVEFLGLDLEDADIEKVINKYTPHKGSSDQKGTHFVKGEIGRFRNKLSQNEQHLCIQAFGPYLEKNGYPLD